MKLDLDRLPGGRSELAVSQELALDEFLPGPGTVRLRGDLQVDRLESRVLVRGELRAAVTAACDRCLGEFVLEVPVPVEILVIRDADPGGGDEDEASVIHQRIGEVDLEEPLREAVVLALPLQRLCRPDCRGLCPRCGADLNEGDCDCAEEEGDPRWEGLPDLGS